MIGLRTAVLMSGAVALIGGAKAQDAVIEETHLTIGRGWAVVRELRNVILTNKQQDILLPDIPPETDLDTLVVRSARMPGKARFWAWDNTGREDASDFSMMPDGSTARWKAASARQRPAGRDVVRCRVVAEGRGPFPFETSYLIRGMQWAAEYQVLVRGELTNEAERVSVDVDGRLLISNGTARAFRNAHLTVVGGDLPADRAAAKEPGFLSLDRDHPLSELFMPSAKPAVQNVYRVPVRADIAARGETRVAFVSSARKPAERVYSMRAEDFPPGIRSPGRPLDKYITFKNDASFGLGAALPPGPAQIYLGAQRTHLFQEASFARTAANEEIRIHLGKIEALRGYRQSTGRTKARGDMFEESFELVLENALPGAVTAEVVESPPVALTWDVVRANQPYEVQGRRLIFRPRLEAKGVTRIAYTLRLREMQQ